MAGSVEVAGRWLHTIHDKAWLPQAWFSLTAADGWDRTNRDIEERCALMLRAILAKNLKGQFYVNCKVLPDDPHVTRYGKGNDATDDCTSHTVFMDSLAEIELNTRVAPARLSRCYIEQPTSAPPSRIALSVHVRSVLCWVPLFSAGINAKHVLLVEGAPYAAVWMCFSMSQKSDGRLQCTGPSWQLAQEEELVPALHPAMPGVDEGVSWATATTLTAVQSEAEPFFPGGHLVPPLLRYLDPRRLPPAWTKRHDHEADGLDLLARETMATTLAHRQNCVIIPPAVASEYTGPRLYHKAQNCRTFSFTGNKSKKATPDFNAAQEKLTNFVNSDAKDHSRFPDDLCVAPVFFEYPILALPAMKMNVSVFAAYMWMPAAFVREAFVAGKLNDVIVARVGGDDYARCALHVKPVKEHSGSGITWSTSWWVAENVPALKVLRGVDDGGFALPTLSAWVTDPVPLSAGLQIDDSVIRTVPAWEKSTASRSSVDMFVLRDSLSVCMRACAPDSARDRVKWVRGINSAVYDGLISKAGQITLTPSILHQGVLRPLLGVVYQIRKQLIRTEAGETLNLLICAIHCGACKGTAVGGCGQKTAAQLDPYDEAPEKRVMALLRTNANLTDRAECLALVDGFTLFLSVWSPVADLVNPSFQAALQSVRANVCAERKQDTAVAQANLDDLSWLEEDTEEGKKSKNKKSKAKSKTSSTATFGASGLAPGGAGAVAATSSAEESQPSGPTPLTQPVVSQTASAQLSTDAQPELDPVLTAAVRMALVGDGRGGGQDGNGEGEDDSWELVGGSKDKDKKGKEREEATAGAASTAPHTAATSGGNPGSVATMPQADKKEKGSMKSTAISSAGPGTGTAATGGTVASGGGKGTASASHNKEDSMPPMQAVRPATTQASAMPPPVPATSQPPLVPSQPSKAQASGGGMATGSQAGGTGQGGKAQAQPKWLSKNQEPQATSKASSGSTSRGSATTSYSAAPELTQGVRDAAHGQSLPPGQNEADPILSPAYNSSSYLAAQSMQQAVADVPSLTAFSATLSPSSTRLQAGLGLGSQPALSGGLQGSTEDDDLKGILQALGIGEQGFDGAGAALSSGLSPAESWPPVPAPSALSSLTSHSAGMPSAPGAPPVQTTLTSQTSSGISGVALWDAQGPHAAAVRSGSSRLSSWTTLPSTPESLVAAVDEALQETGATVDLVVNWVLCKAQAGLLPRYTHLAGPDYDGNKRKLCDLLVRGVLSTKSASDPLTQRLFLGQ